MYAGVDNAIALPSILDAHSQGQFVSCSRSLLASVDSAPCRINPLLSLASPPPLLQDAVIFAGDLAYDMEDDGGGMGNAFFNAIQPIASEVPWNVCPGNHEADVGNTYAQYTNR